MEMTTSQLTALIEEAVGRILSASPQQPTPQAANMPDNPAGIMLPAKASADLAKLTKEETFLAVGKTMRALMAGKGDTRLAIKHATEVWKVSQDDVAVKMLISGTDISGGFLVPEVVSGSFIDLLTAYAVVRSMGPIAVPMPSGNLTLNGGLTGPTASYIGEAQAIPVSTATFRRVALAAKKLVGLVPISNDLLRFESVAVDRIVADWLFTALANREDLAFIRGDGTADTPLGFKNIPGIYSAAMTATPTYLTVEKDLSLMILSMEEANLPEKNRGWLFVPRIRMYLENLINTVSGTYPYREEIRAGKLKGYPFKTTTQIPKNLGSGTETEIYLVNFGDVIIGDAMGITMSMSNEASYTDLSATVRSAFQNDLTLLRAISQHDIGVQYALAISLLTGVTWTL